MSYSLQNNGINQYKDKKGNSAENEIQLFPINHKPAPALFYYTETYGQFFAKGRLKG